MAKRTVRTETLSYFERPLKSADVAEEGNLACLDTADGSLRAAVTATTLIPIGVFDQGVNFTGNGTTVARVKLFNEVRCIRVPNDATNPVLNAHVGSLCYIKNDGTVSILATGRSVAGRVWDVSSTLGVLVEFGDEV